MLFVHINMTSNNEWHQKLVNVMADSPILTMQDLPIVPFSDQPSIQPLQTNSKRGLEVKHH